MKVNLTDTTVITQYRITPSQVHLHQVLDIADELSVTLGNSAATCTISYDEKQWQGTIKEARGHLQAVNSDALHTAQIIFSAFSDLQKESQAQLQELTERVQESQKQIQEAQQSPALQQSAAQRATVQKQVREKQQNHQQFQAQAQKLQQQINQYQQLSISLTVNWLGGLVVFSTSSLPTSAVRQMMPLDGATRIVRNAFMREELQSQALARAASLFEKLVALEDQMQEAQLVTAKAVVLLPSVSDALKRANDARSAVEAAESEVARVRRNAETERGKIAELQEYSIQKRAELTQILSTATASSAQNERRVDELEKRAVGLIRATESHESTFTGVVSQARGQLEECKAFAQSSRANVEDFARSAQKQLESKLEEMEQLVQGILKDAEGKRTAIHELLGAAVAANLSTAFRKRQGELEKGKTWWLVGIILATIAVTGGSFYFASLAWNGNSESAALIWMIRALTLLPLILLDLFFISQYKRKMVLADQYAFKAAVATSFDYYKDELKNGLTIGGPMAEFVTQTVGRLWTEPNHVTELSVPQVRRLTKLLENLGTTAIKEGSAVTQAALQFRPLSGSMAPPQSRDEEAQRRLPPPSA